MPTTRQGRSASRAFRMTSGFLALLVLMQSVFLIAPASRVHAAEEQVETETAVVESTELSELRDELRQLTRETAETPEQQAENETVETSAAEPAETASESGTESTAEEAGTTAAAEEETTTAPAESTDEQASVEEQRTNDRELTEPVLTVIAGTPELSTLSGLMGDAFAVCEEHFGAEVDIKNQFDLTVFAPSNEALADFARQHPEEFEALKANTDELCELLSYHLVPAAVSAGDATSAGTSAETLSGDVITTVREGDDQLSIKLSDGTVKVDEAKVVRADLKTDNGFVHVIDGVLLPVNPTVDIDPIETNKTSPALSGTIGELPEEITPCLIVRVNGVPHLASIKDDGTWEISEGVVSIDPLGSNLFSLVLRTSGTDDDGKPVCDMNELVKVCMDGNTICDFESEKDAEDGLNDCVCEEKKEYQLLALTVRSDVVTFKNGRGGNPAPDQGPVLGVVDEKDEKHAVPVVFEEPMVLSSVIAAFGAGKGGGDVAVGGRGGADIAADLDTDQDGILDREDDDLDGDRVANAEDDDVDGDGIPNQEDEDRDGNGIPDDEEQQDGLADEEVAAEEEDEGIPAYWWLIGAGAILGLWYVLYRQGSEA